MYVLIVWLTLKAELRPHICTLYLNTCKRDCHQKQWEKKGLNAFNMNAHHEHQHNTRKHTKQTLCQKSWKKVHGRKNSKAKNAEKTKKKREQSPDKRVAWEILSKPLVFVWFSQGFCWLTRIRRQESCVPKTSWNHELCPTPWVITTAQKLHARIYRTTFKKNNLSKSHLQISGQNCHYNTIRQGLI